MRPASPGSRDFAVDSIGMAGAGEGAPKIVIGKTPALRAVRPAFTCGGRALREILEIAGCGYDMMPHSKTEPVAAGADELGS
jgi:hypothetical protein